jgi:hypothetical protein
MAKVARKVLIVTALFLGLALRAEAENCASGESIRDTGCACAAGFRVDLSRRWDGESLWETVRNDCYVCPAGTYSAAGDAACKPCAAGTQSDAGAAACATVAPRALDLSNVYSAGIDVDAAVSRSIESLDIDKYLASQAPGLYACAVIGLVGAVLNSVAIVVLFLWVRSLKSAVQTDAGAV